MTGFQPELLSLVTEEAGAKLFFVKVLDAFRERTGVSSAAVYHPIGEGWRFEAASGPDTFPASLQTGREGFRSLEVPGGRLLHTGAAIEESEAAEPLLALLGSGLTISRLRRQVKEHRFQANYRGVELEALYDVGLAIASTLRLEDLSDEILLRAISLLDARRGALFLLEDGSYSLAGTFGGDAIDSFSLDADAEGDLGDWAARSDLLPGATHVLAVRVRIEDRPLGWLLVADKESRSGVGPFPETDRRTLLLFANQAAIALENARLHREALERERLSHEMSLAAQIQERILPTTLPEVDGYELEGWNRPAREVGGDYYQVFRRDDRIFIVMADVTGKGVPAALLVATLHSALDLLLDRLEVGPELFERLNRHILESSTDNKFITLFMAQLEPDSGYLDYISAGHDPGILVSRSGEVQELPSVGLPLGLMAGMPYQSRRIEMQPGDLVCLYTDGYTECASRADEEFGLERLTQLLVEHREQPLGELVKIVDDRAVSFAENLPQADDQTLVVLRRRV